jgi:hypothetical protein
MQIDSEGNLWYFKNNKVKFILQDIRLSTIYNIFELPLGVLGKNDVQMIAVTAEDSIYLIDS